MHIIKFAVAKHVGPTFVTTQLSFSIRPPYSRFQRVLRSSLSIPIRFHSLPIFLCRFLSLFLFLKIPYKHTGSFRIARTFVTSSHYRCERPLTFHPFSRKVLCLSDTPVCRNQFETRSQTVQIAFSYFISVVQYGRHRQGTGRKNNSVGMFEGRFDALHVYVCVCVCL